MKNYVLQEFTWELTTKCNLRCKHCGSACTDARSDELTTPEALSVAVQLADLGATHGTLLGGEPLLRKDLSEIVKVLHKRGVRVCIVTNGSLIDHFTAHTLKQAGVGQVSISIDGPESIHDTIRTAHSYEKAMKAYEHLNAVGIDTSCNTTVTAYNMSSLPLLRQELIAHGVKTWQIQPCLPMGRMENNSFKKLSMQEIDWLIDFVLETNQQDRILAATGENVGYYSLKQQRALQLAYQTSDTVHWKGCHAGIRSVGILSNGDVTGCVSMRSPKFVEGNIRNCSLEKLWNSPSHFRWRREMKPEQLRGVCKTCQYAASCMGGCTSTKLALCDDIYAEYPYCTYAEFLKKSRRP